MVKRMVQRFFQSVLPLNEVVAETCGSSQLVSTGSCGSCSAPAPFKGKKKTYRKYCCATTCYYKTLTSCDIC